MDADAPSLQAAREAVHRVCRLLEGETLSRMNPGPAEDAAKLRALLDMLDGGVVVQVAPVDAMWALRGMSEDGGQIEVAPADAARDSWDRFLLVKLPKEDDDAEEELLDYARQVKSRPLPKEGDDA